MGPWGHPSRFADSGLRGVAKPGARGLAMRESRSLRVSLVIRGGPGNALTALGAKEGFGSNACLHPVSHRLVGSPG